MTTAPESKLCDLIRDFGTVMLATRTAQGELRSRPMALAEVQADGTVWLLTERHSEKLDEIALDNQVNISAQSSSKFVSISGTAKQVEDRQKIADLWNEAWKIWFPGGKDDPTLVLLSVQGTTGEYWDNSGTSGLQYLIQAGKAYLSGTKPDVAGDPKVHAKVQMHA